LPVCEIQIFDSQTQTFIQSQSGTIKQAGHQPFGGFKVRKHRHDFFTSKNGGQPYGFLCASDILKSGKLDAQHVLIEKEQSCERLILSRGCNAPLHCEVRQETTDVFGPKQ